MVCLYLDSYTRAPLGARSRFFLRHLLDADPASNTLSWRWVGGAQTIGKTYMASAQNIQKFTKGRFYPRNLSQTPKMIQGSNNPDRLPISFDAVINNPKKYAVLLHWEDMDWSVLKDLLPNAKKYSVWFQITSQHR